MFEAVIRKGINELLTNQGTIISRDKQLLVALDTLNQIKSIKNFINSTKVSEISEDLNGKDAAIIK